MNCLSRNLERGKQMGEDREWTKKLNSFLISIACGAFRIKVNSRLE